jgi:hypothetical protein
MNNKDYKHTLRICILSAVPLQTWLHGHALMLRYTYMACLDITVTVNFCGLHKFFRFLFLFFPPFPLSFSRFFIRSSYRASRPWQLALLHRILGVLVSYLDSETFFLTGVTKFCAVRPGKPRNTT